MIFDHPIVLSASALESNKRVHMLIEAMALYGKGTLLICGDGSQRDALLSMAISKLKNRFVYLGPLNQEKLSEAYEMCDLLALLSIGEGFGMVLVEAMAHDKPVVCVNDCDRRWIVGEGGIFCDPYNPNDIAWAIYEASKRWSLNPLKEAARFSWDKIIPQWEKLIHDLVGK